MSFSAKKSDLATLEKAIVTANKAVITCGGDITTLKASKVKYDDELARRKAQQTLYNTDLGTAKSDNTAWLASDVIAKQWIEAIKLTYAQTKTSLLLNAEKAKAGYNKLKGTDLDAIASWRDLEEKARLQ